jgi:hypothetical protein
MSQYEVSAAARKYLRQKYAQEHLDSDRSCDCPGCDKCTGNVRLCKCDEMSASELHKYRSKGYL